MDDCIYTPPDGIKAIIVKHRINPRWRLSTGEVLARYLYRKNYGIIFRAGDQINHRCNNSLCLNINHLYLGTQKENMLDRKIAGRTNLGKKFGKTAPEKILYRKLNAEIHKEIKNIYTSGKMSQRKLAEKFGVSQVAINKIVKGILQSRPDKRWYKNLSKEIYDDIRLKYSSGKYSYRDLTELFSVSHGMIHNILSLSPKITKRSVVNQV